MQQSRLDIWQEFLSIEAEHQKLNLSGYLDAMLDNCEYIIHADFNKNSRSKYKSKKRKKQLPQEFRQAFKSLNRDQKLSYYLRHGRLFLAYLKGTFDRPISGKGFFSTDVYSRSFNLKMWKHKQMRLDRENNILYAEKDDKIKTYILADYILRKSKTTDFKSFVLQAINKNPHQKSRTVHLGFKEQSKLNDWMNELNKCFRVLEWEFIRKEMSRKENDKMSESAVFPINRGQEIESRKKNNSQIISLKKQEEQMEQKNMMARSMAVRKQQTQDVVFQDEKRQTNIHKQSKKSPNKDNEGEDNDDSQDEQQRQRSGSEDQDHNPRARRETIIESIAKIDQQQIDQIIEIEEQREQKMEEAKGVKKQDIFHRIMPEYKLQDVETTINYGSLFEEANLRVLGHIQKPEKMKIILTFLGNPQLFEIIEALSQPQIIRIWNPQIQQITIKTLIKSENSAMVYQKLKPFNRLYRSRDFIFLRHVFKVGQTFYMFDKSIQNINYPPFTTIVRGEIIAIWCAKIIDGKTTLIADLQIRNQGYLNETQNINLALKFIKPLKELQGNIKIHCQKMAKIHIFSEQWEISEPSNTSKDKVHSPKKTQISPKKANDPPSPLKTETGFKKNKLKEKSKQLSVEEVKQSEIVVMEQKKPSQKLKNGINEQKSIPLQIQLNNKQKVLEKEVEKNKHEVKVEKKQKDEIIQQSPFRATLQNQDIGEMDIKQVEQMEKKKLQTVHKISREVDNEGMVIIRKDFIKTKYILKPLPREQIKYIESIEGHPIWKGQWRRDNDLGAIIYQNQKIIEQQKGVWKFVIKKIGKNILSGKSVLSISLPVDIFSAQSNLQLFCLSLSYGPVFLQPAVHIKDPIERLKKIVAFGISNSPMYLNMEKPFNPILGETFQCWINGCPLYAEQISHHPPIGALFYQGRGFRLTAQLESKVQFHMNDGCGTNQGIFRIRFNDGMQCCYITPGGQVSGITYGDRKFNMVGKSYYWIESECLFLELVFNPSKKGFFSKQSEPVDYFQGYLCKVKPDFIGAFANKKKPPSDKQIVTKLGKFHGIWNLVSKYEEEVILDINKDFPAKLEYQPNPLPSDANWREDIHYRRIMEVSRSQTQKQRLEVLQRKDRKLRQKLGKKK